MAMGNIWGRIHGGEEAREGEERKERMIIVWQRIARVIGFQRIYGLLGLNHHISEKMCVVAPLTGVQRRT